MTDRPRVVFIGTPTWLRARRFRDTVTGQIITGAAGTVKLFTDDTPGANVIVTGSLVEDPSELGTYEFQVPFDQSGLTEGNSGMIEFFINGGSGFEITKRGRCVFRTKSDDGL